MFLKVNFKQLLNLCDRYIWAYYINFFILSYVCNSYNEREKENTLK